MRLPDQRSCDKLDKEEAGSQLRGGSREARRVRTREEGGLLLPGNLFSSSAPPSTLQYWQSLRDMRTSQKSHYLFFTKVVLMWS